MITPPDKLISHSEYTNAIRASLPKEAFQPEPRKMFILAAHVVIVFLGYAAIRSVSSWLWYPLISLVIGHSLACIGFFAHDLSHHSIIQNRMLRYASEMFCWGIIFVSPTIWHRIHNHTHHHGANTREDPDRALLQREVEKSLIARLYIRLFAPNRSSSKSRIFVALAFVSYTIRNTLAVFYKKDKKPSIVPAKPNYTTAQKLRIVCELVVILLMQGAIFLAVGSSWINYFWASPVAVCFTSAVAMSYIFTHHWLNPLCETNDPLMSTTTVEVHPLFDRIHGHFSHHVEHHLFPSMNPNYYPEVSKLLQEKFPDRYKRLAFGEAWRQLWLGKECISEPQLEDFTDTDSNLDVPAETGISSNESALVR